MKRTFFPRILRALLLSTLLIGCNNHVEKEVVEKYENGNQKKVITYQINNNKKEKIAEQEFYGNGQLRYSGEFANNVKNGEWEFWYKNGTLWSQGYFDDGLRTGDSKVYHKNGNLFYSGYYNNGKKHNLWIFYNEKGEEINRVTFDKGKVVQKDSNERAIVPIDTLN